MWSADIAIARQEKTHFGLSGRYLYRYRLRRGGTTVTEWFTDPFAYATDDVGALAAFDTPDSTAPYEWHDDTWKLPELRHCTSWPPTNGGAKRPVSSGSSTPATPPNIAVSLDVIFQHTAETFPYYRVYVDAKQASGVPAPLSGPMMTGERGPFVPPIDYRNPFALQFVRAVTRYWLEEFHVDGFRYDEAGDLVGADQVPRPGNRWPPPCPTRPEFPCCGRGKSSRTITCSRPTAMRVHYRRDSHWDCFYDPQDRPLVTLHRRLASPRGAEPPSVAGTGSTITCSHDLAGGVFAYHRFEGNEHAIVVLNFSDTEQSVTVPCPAPGTYTELVDAPYRSTPKQVVGTATGADMTLDVAANYGLSTTVTNRRTRVAPARSGRVRRRQAAPRDPA